MPAVLVALEARPTARLRKLALHVDALAIEVERIGEAQRIGDELAGAAGDALPLGDGGREAAAQLLRR